jgi:hypothetical protein
MAEEAGQRISDAGEQHFAAKDADRYEAGLSFMKSTRKPRKPLPAEAIARLADQGRDVSRFFTNTGKMMGPIQRVNVDLASGMLEELDRTAKELNISRQAVIKTLIRQALDQQYLARSSRPGARRRQNRRRRDSPKIRFNHCPLPLNCVCQLTKSFSRCDL